MPQRSSRWGLGLHSAIAGLAATITFQNSLANGFALDDVPIVAQNARVHQLADQAAIWLTPYWPQAGEQLGLFRPLAIFGYALQWAAGDGAPWIFHGVNLLLHVVATILVLVLLRKLASPNAALLGATLFAVHPVHTEVVANVVGQAEIVAAIAVLIACVIHAGRQRDRNAGFPRIAAVGGLFAAGLLVKESAVVLPGLLVALDVAQRRIDLSRIGLRRYIASNAGLGIVLASAMAAYAVLRILVLGSFGGSNAAPALEYLRGSGRALAAFRVWPEYLRLMLFPIDLSADYSPAVIPPPAGLSGPVIAGATILVVTILLAASTTSRPKRGLPFAWFLIAVLPAAHLIIPIGVMVAERTLYLPSVGLGLGVAFLSDHVAERLEPAMRRFAAFATTLILVSMAARAVTRNPDWMSTQSIWDATAEDHPESYKSQWWRSQGWYQEGNVEMARVTMQQAVRTWPFDYDLLTNLAGLHVELGDLDQAVTALADARQYGSVLPRTEVLGSYINLFGKRYEAALTGAAEAERLGAVGAATHVLRASALDGLGRWQEAALEWRAALEASPDPAAVWDYWSRLSRTLAVDGRPAEAEAAADSASRWAPPRMAGVARDLKEALISGCYTRSTGGEGVTGPGRDIQCAAVLPLMPAVDGVASPRPDGQRR